MHRIPSRRGTLAAAVVSILFLGCAKKDKPADSGAAAASAVPAPGAPASLAATTSMPGALTKPIDAYSGDELYALTHGLKWVGKHTKSRDCRNAPGCGGAHPAKKTTVEVGAVDTQDDLSESNVPENGVLYIQAVNKGDDEEARYGLLPSGNGKLEYYMIASKTPQGALQWRLEELDTTPQHRAHKKVSAGTIVGCHHPVMRGARADFKTCADSMGTDSVKRMPLVLQGVQDPMWSACASGCCTFG